MRKIQIIFMIVLGVLGVQSCNDFLDVNPKTQLRQESLFSSESGFKDALTGVYISLKSNENYGHNLTMGTIEHLISNYDVSTNSIESKIGMFNFTDEVVERRFDSIFAKQFSTIANINNLLQNLNERSDVFQDKDLYKLIKGECLALRAFCHFDVLRLWGPVPVEANLSKPILPYVKMLSIQNNAFVSYSDFKNNLLEDINEAESLLEQVDPIRKHSLTSLGNPGGGLGSTFNPDDTYWAYRYFRFNYYAVKALQARICTWFGDEDKAYSAAKAVITASTYVLGAAADFTAKDYTLSNEQIFAISDFGLNAKYNQYFASGTFKKGNSETSVKSQLYGSTGTDIREINLWQLIVQSSGVRTYVCQKYNVPSTAGTGFSDRNRIPLMRLSEMYFIAIETAPDMAEAQRLWDNFRTVRNLTETTLESNKELRKVQLAKEFRKEFYAEGQSFYFYKRINAAKTNVLWVPSTATINYVVPLPKSELR